MHLHSNIFHITHTYHLKNHFFIILPFPLPHFTTNFPNKIFTFVSSYSHSRYRQLPPKQYKKIYKSQGCCYVIVFHFILTSSHLGLSITLTRRFQMLAIQTCSRQVTLFITVSQKVPILVREKEVTKLASG